MSDITSIAQLLGVIDSEIDRTSRDATTIQAIRADAYRYYTLRAPTVLTRIDDRTGEEEQNGSGFVSGDVLNAVEQVKSMTTDAFCRSNQPIQYEPKTGPDIAQAQEWAEFVFYRQNQGEELVRHCAHESALAKTAPVCIRLRVEEKEVPFAMEGLLPQQVAQIQSHPDVMALAVTEQIVEVEPGAYMTAFSATGRRLERDPRIELDPINPEDFGIRGDSLDDGGWDLVYHMESILEDELLERYPEEDVRRLPDWDSQQTGGVAQASRAEFDGERNVKDGRVNASSTGGVRRYKRVCHAFIRIRLNDEDGLKIIRVMYGRNSGVVLEIEETDDHWYECFHSYQVPGKFYGLSAYELEKGVQDSKSRTIREIVNNIILSNKFATEIDETGLSREAKEDIQDQINSLHPTLFTRAQGTVRQIPRLPLPGETLPSLEIMERESEMRAGITRTAQGGNQDAISKQNAADMVEHYINLGQRRIGMMIRANAKNAMTGIFRRIYDLTRQHADLFDGYVIEVGGRDQAIMPSLWRENPDLEIATALTNEEKQRELQALLAWDARLSQQQQAGDEQARLMYQAHNKYAVYSRAADLMGLPLDMVLTSPDSPQWQQMVMSNAQAQQMQQQMAMMQAQKQMEVVDAQISRIASQNVTDMMKTSHDISQDYAELKLDRRRFEWGRVMNIKELELEDEQERPVSIRSAAN